MIAPALLFAAMVSADVVPQTPTFRPIGGATVRASASVRIVSGVTFGRGRPVDVTGAVRRRVQLTDRDGQSQPAELLEFQ